MHKILLSAAFLPAMVYTAATTTPSTALTTPAQAVQTGLGPSPDQGQPYGAGTPGAPDYPFIQAPSTDETVYGTNDPAYIENLNLQAFEQQANIVNQQLYDQWVAQGSQGPMPQYIGVNETAFDQWWASYTPGQNEPAQNFWTGLNPNNSFTSWIGTGGDGFTGAPTGAPAASGSPSPTVTLPSTSTYSATAGLSTSATATLPTSAPSGTAAGNASLTADLQQAIQLLSNDAAWVKDAATQQALANAAAELAAAQQQQ